MPKPEIRRRAADRSFIGLRISNLGFPSDFGFRISDLRWLPTLLALLLAASASPTLAADASTDRATVVLVVGAAGESEFGSNFVRQAGLWEQASKAADCRTITLGLEDAPRTNDCELLRQTLGAEPKAGRGEVWLVLIGHGTFDGKEAKFNLRGPDLSATDLALWLKPLQRPLAVINTASASAPFLNQLSATNRVIITATRSGNEQNYTRFGQFLCEAIADPHADLDKDGQVSLLEAFLLASRRVAEFYQLAGRIVTEHALLDDNGDGLGTPADWFRGVRAVKQARNKALVDGLLAQQFTLLRSAADRQLSLEQRAARDALERQLFGLREAKASLPEDEYYARLERHLIALAQCYEPGPGAVPGPAGAQ